MELDNEARRLAPAIRYSIHLDGLVIMAVAVLALPLGKGCTDTFALVEQEVPM